MNLLVNMQAEYASYTKAEMQPKQVGKILITSLRIQNFFMGPAPVMYEEFKFAYNTSLGKRNRIVIK